MTFNVIIQKKLFLDVPKDFVNKTVTNLWEKSLNSSLESMVSERIGDMNQKRLIKFTVGFISFMFYIGIVVLICLPFILKLGGKYYSPAITAHFWSMLFVYIIAGICGLTIVYQLRKIMRTVVVQDCFVDSNVKSLSMMGRVSFLISVIFIVKLFFFPTAATFVLILTFFLAGIFSHVLSCVFQEAIRYKKENDLTV